MLFNITKSDSFFFFFLDNKQQQTETRALVPDIDVVKAVKRLNKGVQAHAAKSFLSFTVRDTGDDTRIH